MIDPKDFPGGDLKPNYSGLAVIGVGMPRTGLTSLRVALGQLLNGPCHHGANFFDGTEETMNFWIRAFEGKLKRQDWIDRLQGKGYRATVDLPTMLFYKELMDAYPDAKFILSMRDTKAWFKSLCSTIRLHVELRERWPIKMLMVLSGQGKILQLTNMMDGPDADPEVKEFFLALKQGNEEETTAYYHKWVQRMKDRIPAEKLLIHETKDGWEPLCKFLGIDEIPTEPYPRANDTKQMQDMVKNSIRFCNACYIGLPTILAGVAAFAYYKFGPFF